uniref:non-specific serine/threonine protein kinase n=1 Tax=Cajanus cajan TaxID=3821 RepID=A0A151RUR4_CAJCA|nr:Putative cysteine-rich receptor-like protein kinase 31 [Cajanus cajan]
MASTLIVFFTLVLTFFLLLKSHSSAETPLWVKAGYYYSGSEISASDIKATLFTHLLCAFAFINSTSYSIFINSSEVHKFSTFTTTVRLQNPSVTTLLSIRGGRGDTSWRAAITSEARNSSKKKLLLVMSGYYLKASDSTSYPFDSMQENLDWVHFVAYDYYLPRRDNVTGFHAALYGSSGWDNTDSGIKEWRRRGFSSKKLLIGLPYHGYLWKVVTPGAETGVGAPASGPATTKDGSMAYKLIKSYMKSFGNGVVSHYNASFVVNQFTVAPVTWVNFDDVEVIKAKVSYAKENGLLGYSVFQVGNDDNWELSRAAQEVDEDHHKRRLVIIVLLSTLTLALLLGIVLCYYHRGTAATTVTKILYKLRYLSATEKDIDGNASDLIVFSYLTIKVATNNFSKDNRLGEGGFGGKLRRGQEIAVKRLSETSNQGLEEFKNEITLTARLQHVNLVRLLGYCTKREEKILIYEYLPNKSLDRFLFDLRKSILLDWNKRVNIIEGVTQGLLYLQENSNFTIIHRDLKASNVLLDHDMNPKISDFGMARLFRKYDLEANTSRIVGTYGYVPPEYVRKGIYSTKYDVYSFGVLLLQIISGKRTSCYYGAHENITLLEYGGGEDTSVFSSMLYQSSHTNSFIHHSITTARLYGFHGKDLTGAWPRQQGSDLENFRTLLKEWRRRFSSKKLLIGLPYHGYAWTLVTPGANSGVGAPPSGPAITLVLATLTLALLLGIVPCYFHRDWHVYVFSFNLCSTVTKILYKLRYFSAAEKDIEGNASDLIVFGYLTIKVATNNFSKDNRLGEGGFRTVYKGKLRRGQEIAVRRLSETSNQGLEEFNEITLTARIQHVNLVRLLGYCTKRDEKILIYEYLPNKSLDHFLFDPRKSVLKIVETYGYVPPEYMRKGIYSTKFDVYSFGVLLLQIISGKRTSCYYGATLLEYAYELWREGRGVEFVEPSLDDTTLPCKSMRCMQVALLCVQENSADRSSMLEVDSMLKNEGAAIGTPKMLAFSVNKKHADKEETSHSGIKYSSINDVTISQLAPR